MFLITGVHHFLIFIIHILITIIDVYKIHRNKKNLVIEKKNPQENG